MEDALPEPAASLSPEGRPRLRRALFKRDEPETNPSDQLSAVITYLGVLQAQLRENERQAVESRPPLESGRKLLQEKRLSRSGVPLDPIFAQSTRSGHGEFSAAANSEPGILPESGWMDVPPDLTGFVTVPLTPATTVWNRPYVPTDAGPGGASAPFAFPRSPWLRPLAAALALVALAAAGVLTWRALAPVPSSAWPSDRDAPSASNDYPPDGTVSDDALAAANQTLDALARGDLPAASAALRDAHARNLGLPGLSYQAALVALNRGDQEGLDFWTERSIAAHESVSECWYLRANAQDGRGGFRDAVESLEAAAHFSPFSPRYAFFWAEYLRRTGHPALSLPHFQQALRCRPSAPDAELILFKQRIARLEEGHDAAFQAELQEHLTREPVAGDTWLLGAAVEIGRGAFPAAVEDLRRAARELPPRVLHARLRDYLFKSQARQPDLAAFLASLPPDPAVVPTPHAVGKVPVDPATRGLAEADPAAW